MFGDDYTHTTGCSFPGADGKTPDCARSFVCVSVARPGLCSGMVVSF